MKGWNFQLLLHINAIFQIPSSENQNNQGTISGKHDLTGPGQRDAPQSWF